MKKIELKKRIAELEKLVKDKDFLIEFLQMQLDNQDKYPTFTPNIVNSPDVCIDGGLHAYPNPWHSVEPPHCKKCGRQADMYEITLGGRDTGSPMNFNDFGGNMMYTSNSKLYSDNSGI